MCIIIFKLSTSTSFIKMELVLKWPLLTSLADYQNTEVPTSKEIASTSLTSMKQYSPLTLFQKMMLYFLSKIVRSLRKKWQQLKMNAKTQGISLSSRRSIRNKVDLSSRTMCSIPKIDLYCQINLPMSLFSICIRSLLMLEVNSYCKCSRNFSSTGKGSSKP